MQMRTAARDFGHRPEAGLDAKSFWGKAVLVGAGTYLTAVSAQMAVPLMPVPFTMQVFVVMLIAGLYRPTLAAASQALYVAAGACGVPWFAGGCAFRAVTFGYLVGFVVAAFLVATLLRRTWFGGRVYGVVAAMLAGLAVIYVFGAVQVANVMGTSWRETLAGVVAPFVVVDVIKIGLAAGIVYAVRRRTSS